MRRIVPHMVFAIVVSFALLLAAGVSTSSGFRREYKVVESSSYTGLQSAVKAEIDHGWSPEGGVAVAVNPRTYGWWYYQALTR